MITISAKLHDPLRERRDINVWLKNEATETTFYCPFCRNGLIKYRGRVIAIIYGEGVLEPFLTPPISVACSNPHCVAVFHIQGINK